MQNSPKDLFTIRYGPNTKRRLGVCVHSLKKEAPEYFKRQLKKGHYLVGINDVEVCQMRWDAIEFEFSQAIKAADDIVLHFEA